MLQADHIQLSYGRREILHEICLQAQTGQCIGILGANGSGKSTLLRILAGVSAPDAGDVSWNGISLYRDRHMISRYIGYVPQEDPLMEDLSVLDNLKLWYAGRRSELNQALDHGLLHKLELHLCQKQTVRTLSGGQKKRLSIGCALARDPQMLILDEPCASLDLPCKEQIRQLLSSYKKQGGTILITTHEEADLALCDRLLVLKKCHLHEIAADLRNEELIAHLT